MLLYQFLFCYFVPPYDPFIGVLAVLFYCVCQAVCRFANPSSVETFPNHSLHLGGLQSNFARLSVRAQLGDGAVGLVEEKAAYSLVALDQLSEPDQ